jgi:hypothetical protein
MTNCQRPGILRLLEIKNLLGVNNFTILPRLRSDELHQRINVAVVRGFERGDAGRTPVVHLLQVMASGPIDGFRAIHTVGRPQSQSGEPDQSMMRPCGWASSRIACISAGVSSKSKIAKFSARRSGLEVRGITIAPCWMRNRRET